MNRSSIEINVKRKLHAESWGHCMNPVCYTYLFKENAFIGDMAHIKSLASGGSDDFENLILLCKNCHYKIDQSRNLEDVEPKLKKWKRDRQVKISREFIKEYNSFQELENKVRPILEESQEIFDLYGPDTNNSDIRDLWLKHEDVLLLKNEKICSMVDKNMNLFHSKNKEIVQDFMQHAREFELTRNNDSQIRVKLFPKELLSIFGIRRNSGKIVSNISALQNMIKDLQSNKNFISLDIIPQTILTYSEGGKKCELHLKDGPRVNQLYFNNRYFRGERIGLRLENLYFIFNWLSKHNIHVEIEDYCDLTKLNISGNGKKYEVKLYSSYCLSCADLQSANIKSGWLIVNAHMWNKGPMSPKAQEYADDIGVKLFNQMKFFSFCHKNII